MNSSSSDVEKRETRARRSSNDRLLRGLNGLISIFILSFFLFAQSRSFSPAQMFAVQQTDWATDRPTGRQTRLKIRRFPFSLVECTKRLFWPVKTSNEKKNVSY